MAHLALHCSSPGGAHRVTQSAWRQLETTTVLICAVVSIEKHVFAASDTGSDQTATTDDFSPFKQIVNLPMMLLTTYLNRSRVRGIAISQIALSYYDQRIV